MNLYDQLIQLQVVPNAYENWHDYRGELTDYITNQLNLDKMPYGDMAILGVGRGNDLNLRQIVGYTKTLTLWDKDSIAIDEAIKKYGLEHEDKVKCVCKDLIGLSVEDYRLYAERLVGKIREQGRATLVEDLADFTLLEIKELAKKLVPIDLGEAVYDTIIVIGLHSQFLSMIEWIWQVILQTLGKDESSVRLAIIKLNESLIRAFHQQLIKACKGQLIIGCEIARRGRIGTIQGAIQGLQDLEELREKGQLKKKSECLLEWPFHPENEIAYEMHIQCHQILAR